MWKFAPILKTTIWGGENIVRIKNIRPAISEVGESWEISSVPENISAVEAGPDKGLTLKELLEKYGSDLLGERNYKKYGDRFPLLVKLIDTAEDLSVQVHPPGKTPGLPTDSVVLSNRKNTRILSVQEK